MGQNLAVQQPAEYISKVTNSAPASLTLRTLDFKITGGQLQRNWVVNFGGHGHTEPDDSTLLGSCIVTSSIPSGQCTAQLCDPALLSDDALVMVNRDADATLSECSTLDNWTLYEAGRTCGALVSTMTETRLYEATCPRDRMASWGLLTWDTETPGTSEVVWRARTGFAESELSSLAFNQLGVASSSAPDTQLCTALSGQGVCPIDLTAELALLDSAPSFLELEIELNPDGSNAPRVNDFRVTYSCVEDQ